MDSGSSRPRLANSNSFLRNNLRCAMFVYAFMATGKMALRLSTSSKLPRRFALKTLAN